MEGNLRKKGVAMLCLLSAFLYADVGSVMAQNEIRPETATDLSTVPWVEDFEYPENRDLWTIEDVNGDGSTWTYYKFSTIFSPKEMGAMQAYYRFNRYNKADDWLYSPKTFYEKGKTYRLRWWVYGNGEEYQVALCQEDKKVIFEDKISESVDSQREIIFTVDTSGEYSLGFHVVTKANARNLYIDGIELDEVNDLDIKALRVSGTKGTSVQEETVHTVTVQNNGTSDISNFSISIIDPDGNILGTEVYSGDPLASGAQAEIPVKWIPEENLEVDSLVIRAQVKAEGDNVIKNDISKSFAIKVYPFATYSVDWGNINSDAFSQEAPMNMNWKYSVAQSLYFEEEINAYGYINTLTYYTMVRSWGEDVLGSNVKIYMTSLPNDIKSIPVGWIKDNLVLVYDGKVDYRKTDSKIKIVLDSPFMYLGGNLLIYTVKENTEKTALGNNFVQTVDSNFKYEGRTRTYGGNDIFDFSQTGSSAFASPNVTFLINSYGGNMTGKVITADNQPLADALVTIDHTDLSTRTDENGEYQFPFIPVGDYTMTVSKESYVVQNRAIAVAYKESLEENFQLSQTSVVSVRGSVTDGTTALSDVVVVLVGESDYQTRTLADGTFDFPKVYGNQPYTLRVFKSGYCYHESEIVLTDDAIYEAGNVTLEAGQSVPAQNLRLEAHVPTWNHIRLLWDKPEGEVSGYNVYRNGTLLNVKALLSDCSYLDSVAVDQDYEYAVEVINSSRCVSASVTENFRMEPNPCETAVTEFPFYESFESEDFSLCWDQDYVTLAAPWNIVAANPEYEERPYYGIYNAAFRNENRGSTTKLITPMLDITALNAPVLSFYYLNPWWGGDVSLDALKVYYRTSPEAEWVFLEEYSSGTLYWLHALLELPEASATYQLAFEGISDYGMGLYLDEILVYDDRCNPVQNLALTQRSERVVQLVWDAIRAADCTGYKVLRDGVLLETDLKLPIYIDRNVEPGSHEYEVVALYDREDGTESEPVKQRLEVAAMADPVQNLKAVFENNQVVLTWEAPEASGLESYTIKRDGEEIASGVKDLTYQESRDNDGHFTYSVVANYGNGKGQSQAMTADILVKRAGVVNLMAETTEDNRSVLVTWNAVEPGEELHPLDPSKARVVLKSLNIWGDNSGYQMLLDADADTYGFEIPTLSDFFFAERGNVSDYVYSLFEYRIPQNADGAVYTENVISNGSAYVDIEPGTYDYIITRPMPEYGAVCIADGTAGRGENSVFEAGKVYTFEIVKMEEDISNTEVRISTQEEIATYQVYRDEKLVETTRALQYKDTDVLQGEVHEYCIVPTYDSGCTGKSECVSLKVNCPMPQNLIVELTQGEEHCTGELTWDFDEFADKVAAQAEEETVIYDNGDFVTHQGIGYNGADVSALYDNATMYGYAALASPSGSGYYMIEDFVLEEKTFISELEFFVYVEGEAIDSDPIDQASAFILDGHPTAQGTQMIWGDLYSNGGTNRFASSEFTGVYRTDDGTKVKDAYLVNDKPIWSVRVTINKQLAPGKYWIGFGARVKDEKPIMPRVIPVYGEPGEDTGDATILVERDGQFIPFQDPQNMKLLGAPFKIHGHVVPAQFNIYRDDKLIAENIIGNRYVDDKVPGGEHTWKVVFLCEGGESDPAVYSAESCEAVSLPENEVRGLEIYPNPAKDYALIEGDRLKKLQVYDASGKLLLEHLFGGENSYRMNLNTWTPGMYLFKIFDEDGRVSVRNIVVLD